MVSDVGRPIVLPKAVSEAAYKEADEARAKADKANEEAEQREQQAGQAEEEGAAGGRRGRRRLAAEEQVVVEGSAEGSVGRAGLYRRRRLGMAGSEYWDYLRSQGLLWCSRYFSPPTSSSSPVFTLPNPPRFDAAAWASGQKKTTADGGTCNTPQ
jgi:hypothetical protein